MDDFDSASELETAERSFRIEQERKKLPTGESETHCLECGEEIPEARRKAYRGCKLCVLCKAFSERIKKQRGY